MDEKELRRFGGLQVAPSTRRPAMRRQLTPQLRIVTPNPLGLFNPGESIIILCEIYHNDRLFCRFRRLSSRWYASQLGFTQIPKSSRLRLSFLKPVQLTNVATNSAFENCGCVEMPLHDGGWADGCYTLALTKDYEDVVMSGWVDVCCTATRNQWVRAYMVLKGTVLKWQATESGGDNLGVSQWQYVYLDQNLCFMFPSRRADAKPYIAAGYGVCDICQVDEDEPMLSVAPVLDSGRDAQQIISDSRAIVQSIIENAHVYPSGMLHKNFPRVASHGSGSSRIFYGKSLDGITRSVGIELQSVPTSEVLELSSAVRTPKGSASLLEGSVNVLQYARANRKRHYEWPSADSSRLVQALLVLYPDRLVWYKEREKRTVLGELFLGERSVRRATQSEESPPTITTQGNLRRESFARGCFTLVEDAAVAAERFEGSGGRHCRQQRWVFDVAPTVFPPPLESDSHNSSGPSNAAAATAPIQEVETRGRSGSSSLPSYKLANNSFLVSSSSLEEVRVRWIDAIEECISRVNKSHIADSAAGAAVQPRMLIIDPLLDLSRQDKAAVWFQRDKVLKVPAQIRRLLQATDWQNASQASTTLLLLKDLERRCVSESKTLEEVLLNMIQALDATLTDAAPCRFVVSFIARHGFRRHATLSFLAQLLQSLKLCQHGADHASDGNTSNKSSKTLEDFLYHCGHSDPLSFGVHLFWLLQVQTFGVFHPEPVYIALQDRLLQCEEPWSGPAELTASQTRLMRTIASSQQRKKAERRAQYGFDNCNTVGELIRSQRDLWSGSGLIAQIVRTIHRAQHKRADPYELIFDSEKRRIGGFLDLNIIVKHEKVVTGWHRKWTVLFDRGIQYFQSDRDQQAKGYIPLTASSQVKECTAFDGQPVKNCFVVFVSPDGFKVSDRTHEQHKYVLYGQCQNHQQYLMWISQLSHAIVDLKNSAKDDAENISNFNTASRRKYRCVFHEGVHFHSSPVGVVIVDMKLELDDTVYGSKSDEYPNWIEVAHNLWLPIVYEPHVGYSSKSRRDSGGVQKQRQVMLKDITHTLDQNSVALLFKIGDDLRQDMLVIRLFEMFEDFWMSHELDLPLPRNRIISTWRDGGVVEIVPHSATLADIQTKFGGVFGSFAKSPITQYLQAHNRSDEAFDASLDLFTRSVAASCVASCVLGFGDRHNDNIMVSQQGQLFHIDFGHFLGHTMLAPTGQRRELTRFVLTQAMMHTVQQREGGMQRLVELCVKAYLILRSKAGVILQYLHMMIPSQLPEMQSSSSVEYVREMLNLDMDQSAASKWFVNTIDSCFSDGVEFAKSFDDSMHILGQSSRKSVTKRLTAILQSSLMKKLSRVPIVTPYGDVLGPIVYERCFVSSSNARPVILTFETLMSKKSHGNLRRGSSFGSAYAPVLDTVSKGARKMKSKVKDDAVDSKSEHDSTFPDGSSKSPPLLVCFSQAISLF